MFRSHLGRIIPRKQFIDPALFKTVDDGIELAAQVGLRINGVEFGSLNDRGDGGPVFGSGVMASEECILPIESFRPDGSLHAVVVDFDAAVCQEELWTLPLFGDVFQGFTKRRFGSDTGTVMNEPCSNSATSGADPSRLHGLQRQVR